LAVAYIFLTREKAVTAESNVPPEAVPPARTKPSTSSGTPSGSCSTVNCAPRSWGIESKPQACTIRAPVCFAVAWWARYMESTNSGSPVRST
jgi:hypothetical protein